MGIMNLNEIEIIETQNTQHGGRLIAKYNNEEIGWLRYNKAFEDRNRIEVTILEVSPFFRKDDVKPLLLQFVHNLYSDDKYTIVYDYTGLYGVE